MSEHQMKSIWYFVGLMLVVMGLIVLGSGVSTALDPPATRTILAETHPGIWWGAVLATFGGLLFLRNRKS